MKLKLVALSLILGSTAFLAACTQTETTPTEQSPTTPEQTEPTQEAPAEEGAPQEEPATPPAGQ